MKQQKIFYFKGSLIVLSVIIGIFCPGNFLYKLLYTLWSLTLQIAVVPLVGAVFSLRFPPVLDGIISFFCFYAISCGTMLNFYELIPFHDLILHALSGVFLAAIAYGILARFKIEQKGFFAFLFAFSFVAGCGTLWEFFEYFADTLVGTNMQKYQQTAAYLDTGLIDTMEDMIANQFGGIIYIVFAQSKKVAAAITPSVR